VKSFGAGLYVQAHGMSVDAVTTQTLKKYAK
jgi:hypothetical protein